jgi:hypothetical protein
MSRDLIPNVRIRYVAVLPLIRSILKFPQDNAFITKLIDATEPLATRDDDGDVRKALKAFYAKYGLLYSPNCCTKSKTEDFGLIFSPADHKVIIEPEKSTSDSYLFQFPNYESLGSDDVDKKKEELETKQQLFLLDANRKKVPISAIKKESFKKMVVQPQKSSKISNKMQQLDSSEPPVKSKLQAKALSITQNIRKKSEDLKSFEVDTTKSNKSKSLISPQVHPAGQRNSQSAGTHNKV